MTNRHLKHIITVTTIIFGISSFIAPAVYAAAEKEIFGVTAPEKTVEAVEVGDGDEAVDEEAEGEEGEDAIETEEEDEEEGVYADEEIIVTGTDGKEEIIEVPEGLITSEEGDSADYNASRYLVADSTCNMQDINPIFEQEVYIDRLKRMPTAIEMPWNNVVQKFIDRYSGRLRRSVSMMLGAQNFYMPIFEQALEVYDLPLELKYLPKLEADFYLAPALQRRLLPGECGSVAEIIHVALLDERRDAVKASYAAAHYLSDLYQIFGDWSLVIAAYNCGPGNIQKAIQRSGGKRDYWEIYPYLPTETRGYVPAFIAANYIMTYYCEHNICPMMTMLPEESDTIMLYQNLHFKQVSDVLGIEIDELRALNPQYRRDVVTGYTEPTDLRLPKEYIPRFIEKQDEIFAYDVSDLMKRDVVDVSEGSYAYKPSSRSSYRKSRTYLNGKKRNVRSRSNKLLKKKGKKTARSKKTSVKSKKKKSSAKKASSKKKSSNKKRRR